MTRCLVVCPRINAFSSNRQWISSSSNNEFEALSRALVSLNVVCTIDIFVRQLKAATFLGKGNIEKIEGIVSKKLISLVLIDFELSPIQQRNLERKFNTKVLDRIGLILEIFGERAQTKEGVLQVQLAQLEYQKSRLVRSWTHLERQRGGRGFLGGPGETQIESDRRAIAGQISRIKKSLNKVEATRKLHRQKRKKNNIPVISLVGYTNSGKSSIFNQLTGSKVIVKDMLFSTLDTTMRTFNLLGTRNVILSDTVGFISSLPTMLISAFKATLEDVVNSDIILHVRDVSNNENIEQHREVNQIIDKLNWGSKSKPPTIEIYNKIDLLNESKLNEFRIRYANSKNVVLTSTVTGKGFEYLKLKLKRLLDS